MHTMMRPSHFSAPSCSYAATLCSRKLILMGLVAGAALEPLTVSPPASASDEAATFFRGGSPLLVSSSLGWLARMS